MEFFSPPFSLPLFCFASDLFLRYRAGVGRCGCRRGWRGRFRRGGCCARCCRCCDRRDKCASGDEKGALVTAFDVVFCDAASVITGADARPQAVVLFVVVNAAAAPAAGVVVRPRAAVVVVFVFICPGLGARADTDPLAPAPTTPLVLSSTTKPEIGGVVAQPEVGVAA